MSSQRAPKAPVRLVGEALPGCLSNVPVPPKGLWCLGDPAVLEFCADRAVAIVGTREASEYGARSAAQLATAAAKAGLVVVSGLARGIDAAAHRAAIEAGGRTVAVLGTGVDVPYPASHRSLHALVQQNGAVVSEMEPGRTAFPGCFPRRNRIIAGLSKLVVVVEAGFKSGALNTANWAQQMGRDVAAVPGQIDDPRAAGSNQLIRDGAIVLADVEDLLMVCGLSTFAPTGNGATDHRPGSAGADLGPEDRAILLALGSRPSKVEEIAFASSMSVRQVGDSLLRLEMRGRVEATPSGYLRRDALSDLTPTLAPQVLG